MLPSRASVVVVGGGPAGFMAAIAAAEAAAGQLSGGVVLLESTPEPLHKVLISGGGRCNVTHACWDPRLLVDHYPRGGKALRGPFARFAPGDTVAWFMAHGLSLVEEPDGRLFPRSNRSSSVVDTLRRAASSAGVAVHTAEAGQAAEALPGSGFRLRLRSGAELLADRLVLATGSHPSGHRIATSLGHGLVAPVPSLFTLTLADHPLVDLAGVAMDPVQLELLLAPPAANAAATPPAPATAGKPLRQRGPVLITHWGLSGPATLRLTAFAARALRERRYRAELRVDWTGGRRPAELEGWFAAARREQARRQLGNWRPWADLSRRLWLHLLALAGLDASLRWADLPRRGEQAPVTALRDSRYQVSGRGPFGEEFVTAGGIPLAEVNLASMESRLRPGLFLVGELLDVDGVTGGFNFQHCWSSGWLAGQALAAQLPGA
jgi:predicted Rossmann fold flavoprotein